MIDPKMVLNGLKACADRDGTLCFSCPYRLEDACVSDVARDAFELLEHNEGAIASLQETIDKLIKALAEKPEVVRCRDCKNWIPGTIDDDDNFNPPRCRRIIGRWSANEHCSCAERKDDRGAGEG